MATSRNVLRTITALTALTISACGGNNNGPTPPTAPTPPTPPTGLVTANAYILPDATTLGPLAFGEPPMVIYKGERLRWVNLDTSIHSLVPDTASVPEFRATGDLATLAERSYIMNTIGTTTFHCTIHPNMVGTLVVRER
jgi:hypothetical protein